MVKIKKLLNFVNPQKGPIEKIYPNVLYNDEPKIYLFTACVKNTIRLTDGFSVGKFAVGSSFSKEKALLKAMGEALERFSISIYRRKYLIWRSYKDLKNKKINAINPKHFITFSKPKRKPTFRLYKKESDKLYWTKGFSLIQNKNIFVPAQFVFVPYRFKSTEPTIRTPISTGAACYGSLNGAILKGLLEVIERDAYMISYLNKLSRNIIDISNSKDEIFRKITNSIKRYNLEVYFLDISSDVPVYTILSIVIDKTGYGPAVSLGINSSLNLKDAIVGSFEELLHGRFWIRDSMFNQSTKKIKEIQEKRAPISIFDLKERGLYWSQPRMIKKIKFFLEGKKILVKNLPIKKTRNLNTLIKWFKNNKHEVIYVETTPAHIKKNKIYTVRILIPEFQPLCLDERFSYLDGERLKSVPLKLKLKSLKILNRVPQPFM